MTDRGKKWLFGFAAVAIVVVVCGAIGEITLRLLGYRPWDPAVAGVSSVVEGPGGVLYEPDPTLGYALKPGKFSVKQRIVTWSATHRDDRRRTTRPDGAPPPTGEAVWIFGDSNSYGWALDDAATYSWLLQKKHPELDITNFAVGGYSTLQSLIQLEDAIKSTAKRPKMVLLAYASYHDGRNALLRGNRKAWFNYVSRYPRFPQARLDDGKLTYGMVDLEYTPWPLERQSALVSFLEEKYNKLMVLTSHAQDVSRALILKFRDVCREHGVELVFAGIAKTSRTAEMIDWARAQGITAMDISVDQSLPENVVPGDGHPSGKANEHFAEVLDAAVSRVATHAVTR
jgi:hypothetical protein